MRRLVLGELERAVEQGLVRQHLRALDPARRGQHDAWARIVDPQRELVRREAAEDDRVDRAEPRAGEHRHDGLGDHRHVDDDAVAVVDAEVAQRAGEPGDLVAQLAVGEDLHGVRDRAVVDQRGLVRAPAVGVTVERVVARVELTAGEPAVERRRIPSRTRAGGVIQSIAAAASPQKPSGSSRLRRWASAWVDIRSR